MKYPNERPHDKALHQGLHSLRASDKNSVLIMTFFKQTDYLLLLIGPMFKLA